MEGSALQCLCETDLDKDVVSDETASSWNGESQCKHLDGKDLTQSSPVDICSENHQNLSFLPTSLQHVKAYSEEVDEDDETVITGNMLPSPHSTESNCSDSIGDSENGFDEDKPFTCSGMDELELQKKPLKEGDGIAGIKGNKNKDRPEENDNINKKYNGDLSQIPAKRLLVNSSGSLLVLSEIERCNACPYCDDICSIPSCHSCMEKVAGLPGNDQSREMSRKKYCYSPCEILRHRTLGSCWIVANNDVYDVTDFLTEHPAGAIAIAKYGGGVKNCQEDMLFHSRTAQSMWKRMKIGTVIQCPGGFPIFSEFDNKASVEKQMTYQNNDDDGDHTDRTNESLAYLRQSNDSNSFHQMKRIKGEENICTIM